MICIAIEKSLSEPKIMISFLTGFVTTISPEERPGLPRPKIFVFKNFAIEDALVYLIGIIRIDFFAKCFSFAISAFITNKVCLSTKYVRFADSVT